MHSLKLKLLLTLFVIASGAAFTQAGEVALFEIEKYTLPVAIFDKMATEVYRGRVCEGALGRADSTVRSFKIELLNAAAVMDARQVRLTNLEKTIVVLGEQTTLKEEKAQHEHQRVKHRGWIIAGLVVLNVVKTMAIIALL